MDIPTPILPQVAAGDPAALTACMERFSGLVWSIARKLSADPSDAEDAVQEVFIDLWRSAHRYDPEKGTESTFVATIARRRLIDRGRRRQRRPEVAGVDEAFAGPPPASDGTDDRERAAVVERAMGSLRPEQQRVLQLAIHHGATHEQIATSTGMPLGTVKTHARRGLMRLRDLLVREGALPADAGGAAEGRP
jgi:RNA polymerase sigma-70 factor (ECF subfamily)